MLKIAVLISGNGTNLQSIIDSVENKTIDGEISIVISNKRDAYGLNRAKNHNIENFYVNKNNYETNEDYDKHLISMLREKNIDLVVLAGYLKVLSKDFIRAYKNKIINIHPSLIPSFCGKGYYGEKVHQAVLDYGVKYTGATVHFVDEGTDTGPIIMQGIVAVEEDDEVSSLQKKVLEKEHSLLVETIKKIAEEKIEIEGRKVIVR